MEDAHHIDHSDIATAAYFIWLNRTANEIAPEPYDKEQADMDWFQGKTQLKHRHED